MVFTDRSLNHMSQRFITVMQSLVDVLCRTYRAETVAVVPGGGTYAMEAVARQLATGRRCLVIRNGLFSYRWSQIFDAGSIPAETEVCRAEPVSGERRAPWVPPPVDEVVETIERNRPHVVFAAHVETAAGLVLPDDYLRAVAAATHAVGGLFVLDCIASGSSLGGHDRPGDRRSPQRAAERLERLAMRGLRDAQRGWTRSRRVHYLDEFCRRSPDMVNDHRGLHGGAHALPRHPAHRHARARRHPHAPDLRDRTRRTATGPDRSWEPECARLLVERGFPSVAAEGFDASSVVVAFTDDPAIRSGAKLRQVGVQVAAGVPLMCGEGDDFSTFRIGLFGLDKLADVDGTVRRLEAGLDQLDP